MSKKITMNGHSEKSVAEVFEDFVISQTAQGSSPMRIAIEYRPLYAIPSPSFAVFC